MKPSRHCRKATHQIVPGDSASMRGDETWLSDSAAQFTFVFYLIELRRRIVLLMITCHPAVPSQLTLQVTDVLHVFSVVTHDLGVRTARLPTLAPYYDSHGFRNGISAL